MLLWKLWNKMKGQGVGFIWKFRQNIGIRLKNWLRLVTVYFLGIGSGSWKVVGDIRDEDMDDYDNVGVRSFVLMNQVRQR